jgi:hypothetical protein
VKAPVIVTLAALALMVALDALLGRAIPGLWSLFGLASCAVLVVVVKWLGKRTVLRPEGYYEPSGEA